MSRWRRQRSSPLPPDSQAQIADGNLLNVSVQGLPVALRGKTLDLFPETAEVIDNAAQWKQAWNGSVWTAQIPLSAQRSASPSLMPVVLAEQSPAHATGPDTRTGYRAELKVGVENGLPMLCANPDIIVDMGDKRVYCAGALAQAYEQMGAEALYYGKPHPPIYDLARRQLGLDDPRILCPCRGGQPRQQHQPQHVTHPTQGCGQGGGAPWGWRARAGLRHGARLHPSFGQAARLCAWQNPPLLPVHGAMTGFDRLLQHSVECADLWTHRLQMPTHMRIFWHMCCVFAHLGKLLGPMVLFELPLVTRIVTIRKAGMSALGCSCGRHFFETTAVWPVVKSVPPSPMESQ